LSGVAWSVFPQVLVQGFAADAEVTGHQGFLLACRNSPFQLGNLFAVQRDFFRPRSGPKLLSQHLVPSRWTFADPERAASLQPGSHEQHQIGLIGEYLAGELVDARERSRYVDLQGLI
jgi:hypothetical protein